MNGAAKLLMQIAARPGRIDVLVECAGRGDDPRELRDPARHCRKLNALPFQNAEPSVAF
jgi:NAD(P)-dependent dehydrogenase (short-subunit alcohol dehydrogenase family)